MVKEVTKKEFKEYYFKYGQERDGWTRDYWEHFYENENAKKFYVDEPETPEENRMFIISDTESERMTFMTEEAEERFFTQPGLSE